MPLLKLGRGVADLLPVAAGSFLRRALCLVLIAGSVALASCAPPPPDPPSDVKTNVRGDVRLGAEQLALYVYWIYQQNGNVIGSGCGSFPYRAQVDLNKLASLYVGEGSAQGIRADIAFAQSIIETGWFSFPDCGQVRPSDNNFAGIGATDANDPATVGHFPSARRGIRAQLQRLNRYSNPGDALTLARPLEPQRGWSNATQYNHFFIQGTKTTWQSLTGTWATSPCYDAVILNLYNKMRTHYGLNKIKVGSVPAGCGIS